jgi:hypothetical protein
MPLHDFKNARQFFAKSSVIAERLNVAAQDRQRGSQLVRDIRDKVASDLVEPLVRDVVTQNDGPSC